MSVPSQPNPYWQPGSQQHYQLPPGSAYYPAAYPSAFPPSGQPALPVGYIVQPVVQVVMVAQPQTNGKALTSLILGICSYIFGGSVLTGIPAIILGHMALGEIERSAGSQSGRALAIVGLILGYIMVLATLVGCVFVVLLVLGVLGAGAAATQH